MSVSCGVECVVCLGCSRWLWKRCTHAGSDDSASWPAVDSADDFAPIPRACRAILAVYEDDLAHPRHPPSPAGYGLDPAAVVRHADYHDTRGAAPPYLVYADHRHREVILALRGLNLAKESDYKLLLDNSLGRRMFDGGYVHHGLLKSAVWVLKREWETLRELWKSTGCCYKLVFVGHSLGSGVAALMTVLAVNRLDRLGGIPRSLVRCYAIAPARCMSLNLAVKYADVIYSVVLQDDFLPRTPTPLEDIFKSIFCLPCLLFLICLRDTFIPEGRKLRDPRRLYPPGRIYHIVNRKKCRCGRYPPEVRTAIPVDGRFEHIVLSCNTTADHAIIWIEREARKALEVMQNAVEPKKPPEEQRMERKESLRKEHRDALEKAVSLNVPHAMLPEDIEGTEPAAETDRQSIESNTDASILPLRESRSSRTHWDELLEKLFDRDECGNLVLKKDAVTTES